MNVVDSSGWLEYFADSPNADFFAPTIENVEELIVPSISIYEVFKRVLQQRDEEAALQVAALMAQGQVVELNQTLALSAAKISHDLKIPMADSIILATARAHKAILWTQDIDLEGIFCLVRATPTAKLCSSLLTSATPTSPPVCSTARL